MFPEQPPILEIVDLHKRFGGFVALNGLSFQLYPGEILGLAGPNGSGKTTCINAITGLFKIDQGEIRYQDQPVHQFPMYRRSRLGINRTFQVPQPFKNLTVYENVLIPAGYNGKKNEEIHEILKLVGLDAAANRLAGSLNSIQQKLLDFARALVPGPKVLLVDELGAGSTPAELDRLAEILRNLASQGIALLVVEHLMDFLGKVTDRVVVLDAGRVLFVGDLNSASQDKQVIEVFLGG